MSTKPTWSHEEENMLKVLKQEQRISSWKKIAEILNQKFRDSSKNGKQCRDRYINYVRFTESQPKITRWSPEEDAILFDRFCEFGPKWVQISNEMPGKSENSLKNRFYGVLRKIIRKIAKIEKDMKPKPRKPIKEKQIMTILEDCGKQHRLSINLVESNKDSKFFCELYQKLLRLAFSQEQEINSCEVKEVIVMVNKYNSVRSKSLFKRKENASDEEFSNQTLGASQEQIESQEQIRDVVLSDKKISETMCEINGNEADDSLLSWNNFFNDNKDFQKYEPREIWNIGKELDDAYSIFNSHCEIPEAQAFFY